MCLGGTYCICGIYESVGMLYGILVGLVGIPYGFVDRMRVW